MTVRNAVEKAQAATPVTTGSPAQVSVAATVRQAVDRQSAAFSQVLPAGIDPDRFSRLVLTAVKAAPELVECFATPQGETSVLLAAMQAAACGLEPNTPTQECWLLPRRNRGTVECQLSIGYRGYLKLARRSGTVKTIFAEVVHERDEFRWSRGLEADELVHVPYDGDDDPGQLTHCYAVARLINGGYAFRAMTRREVEQHRAVSDSWRNEKARPYSPWTKWTDAMWRKTVIRALVAHGEVDMATDAVQAIATDEAALTLTDGQLVAVHDDLPALAPAPDPIDDVEVEGGHPFDEPAEG